MGDAAGRSKVVGIVIINLIKPRQMFSITLPDKVKGRYWITDTDARGQQRELVSIEAADGAWVAKSNRHVTLLDGGGQSVRSIALYPQCFLIWKSGPPASMPSCMWSATTSPSRPSGKSW